MHPQNTLRAALLAALLTLYVLIITGGCGLLPTPQPSAPIQPSATPTDEPLAVLPTPTPSSRLIRIWLPSRFDPAKDTPEGKILQQRLDAFNADYPDVSVEIRIKAESGPASLMESLQAATNAAPANLPDVVLLPHIDVQVAAQKGFLRPLDGLTDFPESPDWTGFAHQAAYIKETPYALPFVADSLVLVYRTSFYPEFTGWEMMAEPESERRLYFAGADSQAIFLQNLYLSTGASFINEQGLPALDIDTLSKTLSFITNGKNNGWIPVTVTQSQDDAQTWQAYQTGQANAVVMWNSKAQGLLPANSTVTTLYGMQENPHTLTQVWAWAVTSNTPEQQQLAAKLAEYLVAPDFMAAYSDSAHYLPTRTSALTMWSDDADRDLTNRIIQSAYIIPYESGLVGPILKDALGAVLSGQANPIDAATAAAGRVK